MKLNKISAAVGVALVAASGSALAFNPGVTTPDYQINMSGASASTSLVRNLVIDKVCDSTQPIDVFRRAGGGKGWAVACHSTATEVTGLSGPANIMIRKRDAGGSGVGVAPVAEGKPQLLPPSPTAADYKAAFAVDFMEITTGAGSNCGAGPVAVLSTGAGTSYNNWECGANKEKLVPDAGFSDIEPDKFRGINKPIIDLDGDGTDDIPDFVNRGNLNIKPLAGLVFNTPVNLPLRNALQAVQASNGSLPAVCSPLNASYPANAESEQCMPSLSQSEIRSLFTGGIKKWAQILVDDPADTNPLDGINQIPITTHPDVVALGLVPTNAGSDNVHICRRVPGSGTQAQFNAIFLNWPCDEGIVRPMTEPGDASNGPLVANNSGSSDVGKCLDDFANGTNNSGKNTAFTLGPFVLADANRKAWAIGVQSTEKNTSLARDYRFIKVDGKAPTLKNVHDGDYFDFAEQSMQWRNDGTFTYPANAADIDTILNFIADNATAPASIASLNLNFVHSWGEAGWLSVPRGAVVADAELKLSNPVNVMTRSPFGASPNTCQFPMAVSPVQVN